MMTLDEIIQEIAHDPALHLPAYAIDTYVNILRERGGRYSVSQQQQYDALEAVGKVAVHRPTLHRRLCDLLGRLERGDRE